MTKPREKTRAELTAEIKDGQKKIRQFENREKMLRQKLSREERRINPFGTKGALIHPCGRVRSAEGYISAQGTFPALRYGGFAANRGRYTSPVTACA